MIDLGELVTAERVILGLKGSNKQQVLRDLAETAARTTGLAAEPILDCLQTRETLGTTGLGDGIAIPHAKVPSLRKLIGFFARLSRPVEFDTLDGEPVDLVFLLLAPEDGAADHLKALARIARILRDPELCTALRAEPRADRVHALLAGQGVSVRR